MMEGEVVNLYVVWKCVSDGVRIMEQVDVFCYHVLCIIKLYPVSGY